MFLLNLLNSKPDIKKLNDDTIVDLARSTFTMPDVAKASPYVVPSEFVMRPDLVTNSIYGDQNLLDVFLKFNGISNPFALNTGDLLYAPSINDLKQSIGLKQQIVDKGSTNNAQRTLVPKTTQDAKRLTQINAQAAPNNVNTPSDNNVRVMDGQIVFGEDVTSVTSTKCADTVSRAKLKDSLLSKKIFNV